MRKPKKHSARAPVPQRIDQTPKTHLDQQKRKRDNKKKQKKTQSNADEHGSDVVHYSVSLDIGPQVTLYEQSQPIQCPVSVT